MDCAKNCAIIFSFLLCFLGHCQSQSFRKDYTYIKATDSYYKEHKLKATWTEAVEICQTEGSALALPSSKFEAEVIGNMTSFDPDNDLDGIWLSIHDRFVEGIFVDLKGNRPPYVPWREGEPNNLENEDCALMLVTGKLLDVPCEYSYKFVCSVPRKNVTNHEVCETHDLDYFYNIEADRCYKLHTLPKTWHKAFRTCQLEQAEMAVINSPEEAKILVDALATVPETSGPGALIKEQAFVAITDLIFPGVFKTVDGKTLEEAGYSLWEPGQPDNYDGKEHCGAMKRNGKLNDANCDTKELFFCEKALEGDDGPRVDIHAKFGGPANVPKA